MTLVVNLFGGPGAGKSTMAAGIFYQLKLKGLHCELALEYAKDLVWAQRQYELTNQTYLHAKQHSRLFRLMEKVDVIITDSPLLLCCVYQEEQTSALFKEFVLETFNNYHNRNYWINRIKSYTPVGRNQTFEEAIAIDKSILRMLSNYMIKYQNVHGNENGVDFIVEDIMEKMNAAN